METACPITVERKKERTYTYRSQCSRSKSTKASHVFIPLLSLLFLSELIQAFQPLLFLVDSLRIATVTLAIAIAGLSSVRTGLILVARRVAITTRRRWRSVSVTSRRRVRIRGRRSSIGATLVSFLSSVLLLLTMVIMMMMMVRHLAKNKISHKNSESL
jgi:hypothetical protein